MPIPAYPTPTPSVYPVTLPNPSVSVVTPGERRLLSDLSGGPQGVRGIERDYKAEQDLEWGAINSTQAAALNAWWTDTLTQGGASFSSTWPCPQGWVSVTRRFKGVLQWTYLQNGYWKVSAKCTVRGVGMPPTVPGCIPWIQSQACPPAALPIIFGSAACMAVDPLTGYIWCGLSGPARALVYDPLAMTLLNTIAIGNGSVDSIEYRAGSVYVGSPGNSIRSAGDAKLITQIDATSHAIVSSANSSYFGAVSILGMLSQTQTSLYMSIVFGLGTGTGHIGSSAPFGMSPGFAMSDGVSNYINNPFSGVIAYSTFSSYIDLRGAVNNSISLAPYFGGVTLNDARMSYQTCTNNIFVMCIGVSSVLSINTLTGVVQVAVSAFWAYAIYYSPESNILYVEGSPILITAPRTVRAYDGTTFALLGEFPSYVTGNTQRGGTIYLGCESFVMNGGVTSGANQMWRVSFPH